MANILLRSPKYLTITTGSHLSAKLELTIDGTLRYTIIKNAVSNRTVFELSTLCRDSIVYDLQWDTTYRVGDSSYRHAYIQRVYNLLKFNYVEGASDPEIGQKLGNLRFAINVSRLNGDSVRVKQCLAEAQKYENILRWKYNYRKANSTYPALCGYLMYNGVYDVINMGSFNFVNAAFDDVLGRNPTKQEFDAAYAVVDKNEPTLVFN